MKTPCRLGLCCWTEHMLTVLSKNKSYASISIEKGILEAHGIRSWIWDTDGCSWYGEQGAIRCRLVVSSDKIEEAVEILNSDFLALENAEQPIESHVTPSTDLPPYCSLAMLFGLLAFLIELFAFSIPPLNLPEFVRTVINIILYPFGFIISVETIAMETLNSPVLKLPDFIIWLIRLCEITIFVVAACIIISNRFLRLAGLTVCAMILVIMFPWISKSMAVGGIKTLSVCFTTPYIPLAVIASIPVGWGLYLIDFYKSRTGGLKTLGTIFIHMVTWITAVLLILYYSKIDRL